MSKVKRAIALDFDGVIADGLDECLLVAWASYPRLPSSAFSPETLENIPAEFSDRFRSLRNYVRHDGHFLVPFVNGSESIKGASDFDAAYNAIVESQRTSFKKDFVAFRTNARAENFDYWISLHKVDATLVAALLINNDVTIVSGKDAVSIIAILQSCGVHMDGDRVFGQVSDKRPVLRTLVKQLDPGERLFFCDDNVPNLVGALFPDIDVAWATWGYSAAEHAEIANVFNIESVTAEQLARIIETAAERGSAAKTLQISR